MTSRLKRKLNEIGVDLKTKTSENFCLIGTPLPQLAKRDEHEFVPVWKQDVRDDKGRRRLHGAFTGGFSAGYFNSVGSKEGWTPSTFVSSRSDRAQTRSARPEDYMDDEDLAELRDAQKLVDTHESMDIDFRKESSSLLSALESALLPAPTDSAGARLLKKMGWRFGSGIGPKLSYHQRRAQDALPDQDHDEAKNHLYPPRDTPVPLFSRKENTHGLGYIPEKGLLDQVSLQDGPSISAGFGLGALNDADDDDIDIYEGAAAAHNRRLAFDAEHDTDRSGRIKPSGKPLPATGTKLTFRDGSRCLPGFAVSENPVVIDKKYAPPKVPEGWTPNPRRVWEADKENMKQEPPPRSISNYRNLLSSEQRGSMLGEKSLPVAPKSVFDYLKPEDRKRLQNLATGKVDVDVIRKEQTPEPLEPSTLPNIPRLDVQVAKMALQGFQPYASDPVRQARYTAFLRAYAAGEDASTLPSLPGQTTEARTKELNDFASSAQVFRPVSAAMAGRFTSAAVIETGPKAVEGLHTLGESSYLSRPTSIGMSIEEMEKKEKEESPKENAARMGMFGPLTREVKVWVPAKLLCKRFGLRPPEIDTMEDTNGQEKAQPSSDQILAITGPQDSTQVTEGEISTSSSSGKRDLAHIGLGEDETQGQDILTYERPSMDIFKAIFASDDEDDNSGVDEHEHDEIESKEAVMKEGVPLVKADVEPEVVKDIHGLSTEASTYEPSGWNGEFNNAAGKVELTSFKPTFVPRRKEGRVGEELKSKKDRDREGSEKKHGERKKKKGKSSILVSFEVEESDHDLSNAGASESETQGKDRERKKKKRKNEKTTVTMEDEDMWVEAPQPEVVQTFATQTTSETEGKEAGPKGRKRAIDFL